MGKPALKEKENIPKVVSAKRLRYDSLKRFEPLTNTQEEVFVEYNKGQHLFLHGFAGTGKTFLALYLSMKEVLSGESDYKKIVVVRSAVPTREQGFLPGELEEKEAVYQQPYHAIFNEIFNHQPGGPSIIEQIQAQQIYKFISTSYIRGITLHDSIVIVDEAENLDFHELDSIITRLGTNCKIIFCGDFRQSDLHKQSDKEGLHKFMRVINKISGFSHIEFNEEDIVRSSIVKEYIIQKTHMGL